MCIRDSIITEPGDEVLLFDPCYVTYWGALKFLRLKVVTCPQTIDREFQPDPECIRERISNKTAAIILISPDNPTSRVIDEEVAKTIVDIALEKNIWLIYDETYKYLVYEGSHVWIQRFKNSDQVLISLNSFSKDLAIPGFRIGYIYGPRELIKEVVKFKGFVTINTPTISQYLAYYYLSLGLKDNYLAKAINEYRSRRDTMYRALLKYLPEAKFIKPRASMYFFTDVSVYLRRLNMDDLTFCYELAKSKHVYVTPGSVFGSMGKNHLRITFVSQPCDKIEEGIARIAEFLKEREAM